MFNCVVTEPRFSALQFSMKPSNTDIHEEENEIQPFKCGIAQKGT
jgi:hypothetical protein